MISWLGTGMAMWVLGAWLTWWAWSVVGVDASCRNKTELDECLGRTQPLMPGLGLPVDRKQLDRMCIAFASGMQCVDNYTSRCFSEYERKKLEEQVKGARSTLAFLCEDPVFRKEYLGHSACIKAVRVDWERCHTMFKHQVLLQHREVNLTRAQRDTNICCLRNSLLSCVYGYSSLRCGKVEAIFIKKITATLSYSDVLREKCRQVTRRTCALLSGVPAALHMRGPTPLLPWAISLFMFLLYRSYLG